MTSISKEPWSNLVIKNNKGEMITNPILLSDPIKKTIKALKFKSPTPIQVKSNKSVDDDFLNSNNVVLLLINNFLGCLYTKIITWPRCCC